MFNIHTIGDFLLHAAVVVCVFAGAASVIGYRRKDGRLMLAGERSALAVTAMLVGAAILLVHAFLTHDYVNKYVAQYSDNSMPWYYLLSAFWGGQDGSLMLWSVVLSIATAIVIYQNRSQNRDILPTVLTVLMTVQVFFLILMIWEANPFSQFQVNEPPFNGRGLEPLLQNPAMTFHPPSILNGYIWWTIPFAFAVAALVHRRLDDDNWIRTTRRYALVSWAFLSIGNLFGGMWAYEELGWGGFWGWDPVENASLMPWLTATAYLHSVMIQERRGLLKVWNIALVMLTYFLTIWGTFLTRSGFIDSVHTFAQSDIATYFVVFLIGLVSFSIGLPLWRMRDGALRSGGRVKHMLSREGVFLLNNLVLLGLVGIVFFGTIGQQISKTFWEETKYGAPWFNAWITPGALSLLILMGIGPLIPWRKTTWKTFSRNFTVPLIISAVLTAILYWMDAYHLQDHIARTSFPIGEVSIGQLPLQAELTGIYALIAFYGVFFVLYTMISEFIRGALVRKKSTGEGFFTALQHLMSKSKRRYGGYLTHIGFAGLFLGFIGTGIKTEQDLSFVGEGSTGVIEDKLLTFKGLEEIHEPAYDEWQGIFEVHQLDENGKAGALLGTLRPGRRAYTGANVRMSKNTTEKDELFLMKGNVYLTMVSFNPRRKSAEIMAHYNPMLVWMWIGGGILFLGVAVCIWPEPRRYKVLAATQRKGRKRPAGVVSNQGGSAARTAES